MSGTSIPRHAHGHAVAAALARVFRSDIISAMGTCSYCGHRAAIGQAHAYLDGPGVVLRCPECESVLMRWATTPTTTWWEMPGLCSLEMAVQP